jgi:PAS domain S-box-containing protein
MSAGYEMTISDREFEVRVDPLRDKEGQIIGCIGLALDITERKQAEEQIRTLNTELEQRVIERTAQLQTANEQTRRMQLFLTSILENIPDVIFAKDAHNFQFVLINKAAEQLLGFPREEVIGKSVADLFPKNIADLFLARDREIVQLGKPMDIPEEVCHLETEENMILHTRLIPVLDEEDQPQYILGISADITEQKKAAQELHQAWETAKAATNAKSEFLANVSHEIRTPLNGIIGMTRLLLDTPLMPEQRDFVETVRISGDALLAIINDVLDFSKIEAGKMELIHHPFNLRECIEESLTLLAAKASEKNLNLAYTIIDGTPLNIVGDMSRLRQILVNLLSNAVKFTEKGEIVIFVESEALWFKDPHLTWGEDHAHPYPLASDEEPEPPSSPWYQFHIAVRDTGIGIPAAYMERLFISFSQVDPTFTRRYGGTGLGLAISKNLAELMQGKMWAESEEGHGSIFHFTFLATLQSSDTESMEVSKHSGETSVSIVNDSSNDEVPLKTDTTLLSPDIAGKRILIVDDNQTNRHIITNQVISWGMLPCVSNSLADARQWIPMKTLFDMVLIDIHLSDTEGLNLVKELRSDSPTHNLAIVMYTSIANRLETAQQANAHVDAFLTRPIKPAQLYDTLIGVLSRHERADVEEEHTTEHSSATPAPSPPHKPHRSTPLPAPHPPNEQLLGKRHPLRILLVEDNVFNQKVALRFLQKLGYEADIVMNGAEALDAIRTHVYDVVLMDVQMPTMDGLDATRIIRTTFPEHQQPWIIAMTAHAMQGDRERCLDVGMNGYVSKPVKLENLIEALNEVKPK